MRPLEAAVRDAIQKSLHNLAGLQTTNGSWEGEVVWSPVLLAQYLIVRSIVGNSAPATLRAESLVYFTKWQTEQGGWGLHPESASYLFVTTLVYVAMRSIGVAADDRRCRRARDFIRVQGSPLAIPTWGKLWLCVFNLYKYEGMHPLPPEMWLVPRWFPFHPSRLYCHTRLIYLGMSFLFGKRFCRPVDSLCRSLREELYSTAYDTIDFRATRNRCAPSDVFAAPSRLLGALYGAMTFIDTVSPPELRRRALGRALERIEHEQESTSFAALSPVNGMLNILSLFAADPHHLALGPSLEGLEHWVRRDENGGVWVCGARSQTWDTSFVTQAACAGGAKTGFDAALVKAASFLSANQIKEELAHGAAFDRDPRRGGWCFSDSRHAWPVSDTTAEALCAAFALREKGGEMLDATALESGILFLLSRQNPDGGWGSYEHRRGSLLLEKLNSSEMFGSCMVEHSYVECTASALDALARFRRFSGSRQSLQQVTVATDRGARFILKKQESDGSWPGFWGINYTYGTFFAIRGLCAFGNGCADPAVNHAVRRACDWLIAHQKPDGGWGEHYSGVLAHRYVEHPSSQVIMTAWALLALLMAKDGRQSAIECGIELLISRQGPNGSWPREGVAGVFFETAMLHYDLYREYFPLWAFSLFQVQNIMEQ